MSKFVALFVLMTAVATLPMGWAMMILFGNLHHVFAGVPAIGFSSAYSIAVPLAVLLAGIRINFDN